MPQVSAHYSDPTACQAGCRMSHSDYWLVSSCTAVSLQELVCFLFLLHLLGQWDSRAQGKDCQSGSVSASEAANS